MNVKYLSVLFGGDDSFDSDEGYQGMGQFLFIMEGSEGDHAFEMDSQASKSDTLDSMPRSHPQFYSFTALGGGTGARGGELMHVNDGTGGKFGNAILAYGPDDGLNFEDCGSMPYTQTLPSSSTSIGASGDSASSGYFYFSANNIVDVQATTSTGVFKSGTSNCDSRISGNGSCCLRAQATLYS